MLKEKRELGNISCKKYASYLNSLEKIEGLNIIDSSISAFTIIEDADLVISWPYTSTGLIAKNLNKPSAFFDVTGRLANNEEISHGVEFLGDKNRLQNWLSEKLTKDQNHHRNL
jgi:polysaccharide biosynthesis PFTS motif protein